MLEHCDFDQQPTTVTDAGRLRPDLVVNLPGQHTIVVDAKVPLEAFLDAQTAPTMACDRASWPTTCGK